jgi:hypothetical protein
MAGEALFSQNPPSSLTGGEELRKRWGKQEGAKGYLRVGFFGSGMAEVGTQQMSELQRLGARLQRWSGKEEEAEMSQGASGDHVEFVQRLRPGGGWLGGGRRC